MVVFSPKRVNRDQQPHTLYRFFDDKNRLLYIGMTWSLKERLHWHEYEKPWYPMVDRIEHLEYPDKASAREAELLALESEGPIFNFMHRPGGHQKPNQRVLSVSADPWFHALIEAHDRGESIDEVVSDALRAYVEQGKARDAE